MGNNRVYRIGIEVDADDNASGPLGKIGGAADSIDDSFSKASGKAGGLGASLAGLISPGGLAVGAITAIGGAAIAVGAHAMQLADQVDVAGEKMQTKLGLSEAAAESFEGVMRDIYANNYGAGFEDIGEALTVVDQQFARINDRGIETDAQLQAVTQQAIAFTDAFGEDMESTVGAQVTLMEQFGLTSTQAMDFLVAGQQRGLNASGDLLDSIGEYAVQFGESGASADEFFSILETGAAGGVLGTDKIADAFKELRIRLAEGSNDTQGALDALEGHIDSGVYRKIKDGTMTLSEMFPAIIEGLKGIEDPIERNNIGVKLFGTQWEDLTGTVITSIDLQKTSLEDLEGAALSLEEQYKTSSAAMESATRKWDNALVDLGEEFNEIKEIILPALASAVDVLVIPMINIFTDWLGDIGEVATWVYGLIQNIITAAASLPDWLVPDSLAVPAAAAAGASGYSVTPMAGTSSGGAGAAGYGASVVDSNNETHVNVYIERGGDLAAITDATETGIRRAQKSRGQ